MPFCLSSLQVPAVVVFGLTDRERLILGHSANEMQEAKVTQTLGDRLFTIANVSKPFHRTVYCLFDLFA